MPVLPSNHAAVPRRSRLVANVTLLVLLSVSCRSSGRTAAVVTPAPDEPQTTEATEPDSIRWVRQSAEYVAALEQVYRLAAARLESETRGRPAGSWAVILDADETLISNVTYQAERARLGLPYTPETWNAWVRRREATPLPGGAVFLARVRALGGRIAIVTNRLQSECEDTAAVFAAHALVYDAMLCRENGGTSDKNPRFDAVAQGRTPASATPVEVLAYVGDNILDFPRLTQAVRDKGAPAFEPFGVRYFVVPNPMYGSWQ